MNALLAWLDDNKERYPPRSALGQAISYAINRGDTLTRFLDDMRIPLDKHASERAPRIVALGRKNFLFVGNPNCGSNIAGPYSLIATCDLHDVDQIAYLKDGLIRARHAPRVRQRCALAHLWIAPARDAVDAAA